MHRLGVPSKRKTHLTRSQPSSTGYISSVAFHFYSSIKQLSESASIFQFKQYFLMSSHTKGDVAVTSQKNRSASPERMPTGNNWHRKDTWRSRPSGTTFIDDFLLNSWHSRIKVDVPFEFVTSYKLADIARSRCLRCQTLSSELSSHFARDAFESVQTHFYKFVLSLQWDISLNVCGIGSVTYHARYSELYESVCKSYIKKYIVNRIYWNRCSKSCFFIHKYFQNIHEQTSHTHVLFNTWIKQLHLFKTGHFIPSA